MLCQETVIVHNKEFNVLLKTAFYSRRLCGTVFVANIPECQANSKYFGAFLENSCKQFVFKHPVALCYIQYNVTVSVSV
jgi:hypothetical protein